MCLNVKCTTALSSYFCGLEWYFQNQLQLHSQFCFGYTRCGDGWWCAAAGGGCSMLVRHVLFDGGGIDLAVGESGRIHRGCHNLVQRGLPLGALARDLPIHGEGPPSSHGWWLSRLTGVQQLLDGIDTQTFVVVIVEL